MGLAHPRCGRRQRWVGGRSGRLALQGGRGAPSGSRHRQARSRHRADPACHRRIDRCLGAGRAPRRADPHRHDAGPRRPPPGRLAHGGTSARCPATGLETTHSSHARAPGQQGSRRAGAGDTTSPRGHGRRRVVPRLATELPPPRGCPLSGRPPPRRQAAAGLPRRAAPAISGGTRDLAGLWCSCVRESTTVPGRPSAPGRLTAERSAETGTTGASTGPPGSRTARHPTGPAPSPRPFERPRCVDRHPASAGCCARGCARCSRTRTSWKRSHRW